MFATPFLTVRAPARAALMLCLVIPFGFGALALALGQDANWDLRNYHWYNAYRFLTGRLDTDLGASTPYNPLLDVPLYLGATLLSAKAFSFLLGCVHGLNFVLLYVLARAVLAPVTEPNRTWAALAVALCGVAGGGHIGLVGTSFHDNVVSLAIIGAMIVVARAPADIFHGKSWHGHARVGVAGTLLGLGVGLKLPTITFAVGLCFAFLLVVGTFRRRLFLAFWFGIGIVAGMAASCGFWMLHLWNEYRNPIFPYFNNVFKSPLGLQSGNRDMAYVPKTFLDALTFPLQFSFNTRKVGEVDFRDFRIVAAYLVLIATPLILRAPHGGRGAAGGSPGRALCHRGRRAVIRGLGAAVRHLPLHHPAGDAGAPGGRRGHRPLAAPGADADRRSVRDPAVRDADRLARQLDQASRLERKDGRGERASAARPRAHHDPDGRP